MDTKTTMFWRENQKDSRKTPIIKLDLLFLHISLHRWREMSASRDGCQGWRRYCPELALLGIPNSALKLTTSPGARRL